jgi:hypothetical protein
MRAFIATALGNREKVVSRLAKQIPDLMKTVAAEKPLADNNKARPLR